MTLGTHAIVGASVASLVPTNPLLAFILGFASHFLLDAIPHWDYKLYSLERKNGDKMQTYMHFNRFFLFDFARIGFDALLGLFVAFIAFRDSSAFPYIILVGATGAMLPDALQFVYFKWKKEPVRSLQRFHGWIHAERRIYDPLRGIVFQILVVIVAISLVSTVRVFAGF